ncbi:uncharacterized protein [Typha angustifolia]|uniref:uncharacterized protein n=1 Tax=Typha angustifolia TaxID=59011 RepID=UPI003C2CD147
MGVELMSNDMVEDGYTSDSEAFSKVIEVLDAVRMAPNLIPVNDKERYDDLLRIVYSDPNKKIGPDDEALLVTASRALSGAVSKIDTIFHGLLLNNIFDMSIWNYGVDARNALLHLITALAAVPDKFLDGCLHMLVRNFLPPQKHLEFMSQPRWLARKKEIHHDLLMALNYISDLVPLAPMKLKEIIDRNMPKCNDSKAKIVTFVECMLRLESDEIGDFLGSTLLAKVVDLLTDLDVNICWDDNQHEDQNKGIFDMELEDLDEYEDKLGKDGAKPLEGANRVLGVDAFADKLDGLMVIVCEHLKSCADDGRLLKEFDMLMDIFRRSILRLHKSKFSQFILFYACSLDPEICGVKFAVHLTEIFVSKTEDAISRMSAVSYLGSYLSRAKFISPCDVVSIIKRLVDCCFDYCRFQNGEEKIKNPKSHQVFYAGCQAVMYVLCYRMRSIMDTSILKSQLLDMPLGFILSHPLDPLKVCLPLIVQEFLRQAKAARMFNGSVPSIYENSIESELSKAFGGTERLDIFFPFDPYKLKDSDRFMLPNFQMWNQVTTTYSNCNSEEDDEEYEDLDSPEFADDVGNFEDLDNHNSDDDLEYSMNKMSITPTPTFQYPRASNLRIPSQMPARIRPSVSPPY